MECVPVEQLATRPDVVNEVLGRPVFGEEGVVKEQSTITDPA